VHGFPQHHQENLPAPGAVRDLDGRLCQKRQLGAPAILASGMCRNLL
jgi:hypothetical protein